LGLAGSGNLKNFIHTETGLTEVSHEPGRYAPGSDLCIQRDNLFINTSNEQGDTMRKLKLQMQMTIDGFVAGPEGELDWMAGDPDDEKLFGLINELTDSSDVILMGRKMTGEFVSSWEDVVNNRPDSPWHEFAKKMVEMKKIVFSKTVESMHGENVTVENGDVVNAVNELKGAEGKDIVVYGGAGFVSSLLDHGLIDELNLFINPTAIGSGMRIFSDRTKLKLVSSEAYRSGVVVNTYVPAA
jgi:dihydrofolate reductase